MVFSININNAELLKHEFHSKEACLQAAKPVIQILENAKGSPLARTTGVICVPDIKPVE